MIEHVESFDSCFKWVGLRSVEMGEREKMMWVWRWDCHDLCMDDDRQRGSEYKLSVSIAVICVNIIDIVNQKFRVHAEVHN